jgi:hypothetical protein
MAIYSAFVVPDNTFSDMDAGDSLTYQALLADGNKFSRWKSFYPIAMSKGHATRTLNDKRSKIRELVDTKILFS